jgi:hypothetical protein
MKQFRYFYSLFPLFVHGDVIVSPCSAKLVFGRGEKNLNFSVTKFIRITLNNIHISQEISFTLRHWWVPLISVTHCK